MESLRDSIDSAWLCDTLPRCVLPCHFIIRIVIEPPLVSFAPRPDCRRHQSRFTMWPTKPVPPRLPDAASPFKSKPTKTNTSDSLRFKVDDGTSSVSKPHAPVQLSHLASLDVEEVHKLLESNQDTGPTLGNVTLEVYRWKEFDDKKKVFDRLPTSLNICEHTGNN